MTSEVKNNYAYARHLQQIHWCKKKLWDVSFLAQIEYSTIENLWIINEIYITFLDCLFLKVNFQYSKETSDPTVGNNFHAHRIQQPTPNFQIWIYNNFYKSCFVCLFDQSELLKSEKIIDS